MKKYVSIFFMVFALAGCGTSTEPNYFSLAPLSGPTVPEIVTVIKIHRPVLAGYLDRPDFVQQKNDYQLLIDATDNWAEPLDAMFARILAADIQQRLPSSIVVTEDNATPSDIRFTIDMNIQRFNQKSDGDVLLQGELIVGDHTLPDAHKPIPIQLTADATTSPQAVTNGLSRLLADLATTIIQDTIIPDMHAHGAIPSP